MDEEEKKLSATDLVWEEEKRANCEGAIRFGGQIGEGNCASAIAAAALGIKQAFENFAASMSGTADAIRALVSAFEEIEREEARRRVLGWEDVWLWD